MIRYYFSGFDINNAFGHGIYDMLNNELSDKKSIVYIPGGNLEKVKNKYLPIFREHFKNVGIEFENEYVITLDTLNAKKIVSNASLVFLMGGDPFFQKELCQKLDLMDTLKSYNGVMMGMSAGAMLMSKYIIIIPCSEEYPNFRIEEGLNLDGISIYPHNNIASEHYPDILDIGDEVYYKKDLIKVAKEYGSYYLLQDCYNEDGSTDVSFIKSNNGMIEFYKENNGRVWEARSDGIFIK